MILRDGQTFFSLNEVTLVNPYTSGYLRIRILQKKLRGIKIDGAWYTTALWFSEYIEAHADSKRRDSMILSSAMMGEPKRGMVDLDTSKLPNSDTVSFRISEARAKIFGEDVDPLRIIFTKDSKVHERSQDHTSTIGGGNMGGAG